MFSDYFQSMYCIYMFCRVVTRLLQLLIAWLIGYLYKKRLIFVCNGYIFRVHYTVVISKNVKKAFHELLGSTRMIMFCSQLTVYTLISQSIIIVGSC